MDKMYGIGITNRYSCFLDNEDLDPLEQLRINENERETKKKEAMEKTAAGNRKGIRDANAPKGNANTTAVRDNKAPRNENMDRRPPRPNIDRDRVVNKDRPFQGDRDRDRAHAPQDRPMRFNNDDREARNNRRNQDESRDTEFEGRRGDGPRGGGYYRDRERGRGGYSRGSRGGIGGGVPRKREFDRQSGSDKSGVKAVDKRDGAGSRNWGTYKDELEVTTGEPANDSMEEKVEGTEGAVEGQEEDAENAGDTVADDQPKLMTLDEWKALQQPRAKPVFNLRKAGEGEDPAQWKQMTLKKKEKQAEEEEEDEEEVGEYDCPQRAGREKRILDVNFHFADSRRGGGGRGFDGPGRGRGGRGMDRGMDRGGRDRPVGDRDRGDRGGGDRGGGDRGDRPREDRERGDRGERSERGDRGGRGFGRGFSRGRGGYPREDRSNRQALVPKVDDERDFPALLG